LKNVSHYQDQYNVLCRFPDVVVLIFLQWWTQIAYLKFKMPGWWKNQVKERHFT